MPDNVFLGMSYMSWMYLLSHQILFRNKVTFPFIPKFQ